jgi:amino acid adenylation domain-containing protein
MPNLISATPLQIGISYLSEANINNALYVTQVELKIYTELSVKYMEKAWNLLFEKNALLRAYFKKDAFVFNDNITCKIEYTDLSKENNVNQQLKRIKDHDLDQPIPLNVAPLMRFKVIKLSDKEFVMLWSHHHILFDATSFCNVLKNLLIIYENLMKNKLINKDIIVYENSSKINNTLLDTDYWRNLLCGYKGAVPLSIESNSKTISEINRYKFSLSQKQEQTLEKLAESNGLTLNTIIQGAWGLLIAKYCGINDIVFGAVRAYPRDIIKNHIGLQINNLPVRAKFSSNTNLIDYLKDIRMQHNKIRSQFASSLQDIHALSDTRNDHPLFNTVVDFKTKSINDMIYDNEISFKVDCNFIVRTNYPIMLEITNCNEGLEGIVNYDTSRYSSEGIVVLIDSYITLLDSMGKNFNSKISDLEFLSDRQKNLLLNFNDTSIDLSSGNIYLHSLFESSAELYSDNTAVISEKKKLTYKEINQLANKIAWYLRSESVKPNELVAVCMEKGWEEVVATIAILKSGAAYIPINADFPENRINQLLSQADVRYVLTQRKFRHSIKWPEGIKCIVVDTDEELWKEFPVNNPNPIQKLDDLAYVIFTSGSTGTPKGVMISHRGATNTILDINKRFHLDSSDVVMGLSALNFDLSVFDIFGVLGVGGKLVLPSESNRKDPSIWLQLISKNKITIWNTVPALLQMLLEYSLHGNNITKNQSYCKSIRLVLLSGDWIPIYLYDQLTRLCPDKVKLISLGGATEASIWSILYPINNIDATKKSIPYGKPMANQYFYVLDEIQKVQPINVPGELYIGGIGVANGYWKDKDRSEKSFIHHQELGYLYRTGDLGILTDRNVIEFLGRIDQQVKISGHRIELGEIEENIRQLPQIKDAIVQVHSNQSNEKLLVVYYTINQHIEKNEIKNHINNNLPSYMIPKMYVEMESFPLSSNGKVDYKALVVPECADIKTQAHVNPRNNMEKIIYAIWVDILGIDGFGIDDNFFELGGHSLKALQTIIRIKESLNLDISIKEVFEFPSIRQLANNISKQCEKIHNQDDNTESPQDIDIEHQLSDAQKRIWFVSQLADPTALYNISLCYKIDGNIDAKLLEKSLNFILKKHTAFQTEFINDNEMVYKKINKSTKIKIEVKEVSEVEQNFINNEINLQTEIAFELSKSPLIKAKLISSEKESVLIITVHHIIFDGWSVDILLKDLASIYNELSNGIDNIIEINTNIYAKLNKASITSGINYWKSLLDGELPVLKLPIMYSRPERINYSGKTHHFKMKSNTAIELHKISIQNNVTKSNILLGTLFVLLKLHGQLGEPAIGIPVSLRNSISDEKVIGCYLNTLLARINVNQSASFRNIVIELQNQFFRSLKHRHVSFEKIVENINQPKKPGNNPLFQVMFTYQSENKEKIKFSGFSAQEIPVSYNTAKFDLTMFVFESNETDLSFAFEYRDDLFSEESITKLSEDFIKLIERITFDFDVNIKDISIDNIASVKHILSENNICEEKYLKLDINLSDTPTEKILTSLYARLLNIKKVSKNDNFFELGGQSFTALKLILSIEDSLGIKIPLKLIFETRSISDLANIIDKILAKNDKSFRLDKMKDSDFESGVL